ncbi:hypothetical protein [Corynebacterium argentoratense]|uniref:hypothetical protein n=1 Tax=Corynebacterium argentoratense TaxID=42817 RepID=UPI001F2D7B64|nr:hypothetical protein [Corynebacterium argentoratense]MCF1694297.1 hypothetical protein [Corynebacterium argentoratense]MCF1735868.1 hypothetical protein [Corynebacterium argentoratense]
MTVKARNPRISIDVEYDTCDGFASIELAVDGNPWNSCGLTLEESRELRADLEEAERQLQALVGAQ